ncbi:oligosaccharide flippase family protein [Citrobacter freundii]|uniref:Putative O-antigen transporter n=1 Tax=Citrobacter freundii TaxID=546 RepID=A0AAE7KXK1_CITFR|nr:oligosaccharide flippase family protein [Citrobacter freundii]QLO12773.1 oligosaccharide flippase family protein [Citrobacter freundii]
MHKRDNLKVNIASGLIYQVSILLSPLITLPYLARVLDTGSIGLLAYSWAITQYIILIVEYGFNLTGIKYANEIEKDSWSMDSLFSNIFFARLFLTIGCGTVLCVVIVCNHLPKDQVLIYFGYFLQVFSTVFVSQWYYRFIEKIKLLLIPASLAFIFIPILTYIFVTNTGDVYLVAIIQGTTNLLSSILAFFYLFKKTFIKKLHFSIRGIVDVLKKSFNIFIANISFSIYAASPPIVLAFISNLHEVALFSVASRIRAVGVGFLLPIANVLYSKVNREIVNKNWNVINKISLTFVFLTFIVSVVIFVFSKFIVMTLLGSKYLDAVFLVRLFSFVIFLVALNTYFSQSIILSLGLDKLYSRIPVFCTIIFSIVIYPLVKNYDALGAVIGILIVEIFSFMLIISSVILIYKPILKKGDIDA